MRNWKQTALLGVVLASLAGSPALAQNTSPVVNVYSMWVKLSLRGYAQEEIESVLKNIDPKTLDEVKGRLRRSVISNLQLKKIDRLYARSRDYDDQNLVMESIRTEIRFAGLETDPELKLLIKDRFGISLAN
ncbi:MAG: hypothetical protein OEV94_01560 [Deltaproteobacteria bacterium]|nr:hypothetical protein [Deltaproteobacteria bacterium]